MSEIILDYTKMVKLNNYCRILSKKNVSDNLKNVHCYQI